MAKKKRIRKVSSKKLKIQIPIDFLTDTQKKALASDETLFPEKVKRANETLAKVKLPDFLNSTK
jgi:hypothetical protein